MGQRRAYFTEREKKIAAVACKNYRKRNGFNQAEMAEDMGCNYCYISRVETLSKFPVPIWLIDKILKFCSMPEDFGVPDESSDVL